MYFFPKIMRFQHWKKRQASDYKAAVPGLNPAKASIPGWQHKLTA